MKTAPIVELQDVEKSYQTGEVCVDVLRGINLRIDAGDFVSITGRSGAGKSTLMHILGCLDQPTAGKCLVRGEDVSTLDDDALSDIRGRTIGFVFQSFHLLDARTIVENVALPMEYQDTQKEERRERASMLLEKVGLGHRLNHRPKELSGGERQRVAIARSLANKPQLLLADEPTGNLDVHSQGLILELFAALHDETGVATVLVTHDPDVAKTAPRRVVVSKGRVEKDDGGAP